MTEGITVTIAADDVRDDCLESMLLILRDELNNAFPGSTRFIEGPPPAPGEKQGVLTFVAALVVGVPVTAAGFQIMEYLHRARNFLKDQSHGTYCVFKHNGREVKISGNFGPEQITAALNALHPEAKT